MTERTWLEKQIIAAKEETQNWSEWKREAMRIDDRDYTRDQNATASVQAKTLKQSS